MRMVKKNEVEAMDIDEMNHRLREANESGNFEGENRILKQILEQLLKIELIPKFSNGDLF